MQRKLTYPTIVEFISIRRLVGSTNQADSELRENQWNELLFFEIVPSH